MPAGAVYVGRPSRWGNPFRVGDRFADRSWWHRRPCPIDAHDTRAPGEYLRLSIHLEPWTETIAVVRDRAHAVELFRAYIAYEDIDWATERVHTALAGRDLACWCPLDQPCHADVLLEIAGGTGG